LAGVAESSTSLGVDGESKAMLDIATPDMYRINAFRVLGLSVNVSPRDLTKHQGRMIRRKKLGDDAFQAQPAILPLKAPPDVDAIRRANQRLQDPVLRIVDELFWFWPVGRQDSAVDTDLTSMQQGHVLTGAHSFWLQLEQDRAHRFIAIHNLAVLHHAIALDMEHTAMVSGGKPGAKFNSHRDTRWQMALKYWSAVVDEEAVWERLEDRIRELDDPQLKTSMVRQLRRTLPTAILTVSIRLAVRFAQRGDDDAARRHLGYVHDGGLDPTIRKRILDHEVAPMVDEIKRLCEPISAKSKADPDRSAVLADQLMDDTGPLLASIGALLSDTHYLRILASEAVVSAARECLSAYGIKTGDLARCTKLLRKCRSLAISDASRTAIDEDLAQVDGILKEKEDERAMELVDQAIKLAEAGQRVEGRRMLEQALATCADVELRRKIALLIRHMDGARDTAAPQQNAGGITEPVRRVFRIAVVIGAIALIGWLADSCGSKPSRNSGSYTPNASPSDQQATPRSSYGYSGLSSQIDSGKDRAKSLEVEIERMDERLASLSSFLKACKDRIDGYEGQLRSGRQVDHAAYELAIQSHNSTVQQYNSLLADRNAKCAEYRSEIESVNDMVRRFNSGER
jgi:hypothetical protein